MSCKFFTFDIWLGALNSESCWWPVINSRTHFQGWYFYPNCAEEIFEEEQSLFYYYYKHKHIFFVYPNSVNVSFQIKIIFLHTCSTNQHAYDALNCTLKCCTEGREGLVVSQQQSAIRTLTI